MNKDGVLGALWLDTRNSADGARYEAFFAASLHGGETFLPSVVVSSERSLQRGPGNIALNPVASKYKGEGVLSFLSAYMRWGQGGDYIGMAADRRGVFFPLWPDARSGTSQLYTAAIRVEVPTPPPTPVPGMPTPAPVAAAPKAPERVRTMVPDRVDLVFDPSRFDSETNTVEIPVRLKNTSERAIYPPISLEIVGFHCGLSETEEDKKFAPSVLNAGNGKQGVGAAFPFDASLRGSESLTPGALSGPIVLRFKLSDPVKTPCTHFLVFGMVDEK